MRRLLFLPTFSPTIFHAISLTNPNNNSHQFQSFPINILSNFANT
jgi:hypothetical protein